MNMYQTFCHAMPSYTNHKLYNLITTLYKAVLCHSLRVLTVRIFFRAVMEQLVTKCKMLRHSSIYDIQPQHVLDLLFLADLVDF